MTFAPGDVVLAQAGTKRRPCVLLRVAADEVLVVVPGTGTERDQPHVAVLLGSQAARAMRLDKSTYFYATVVRIRAAALHATGGRCPPEIFQRIRELLGDVRPGA